jgi:hypothetical protein
MMAYTGRTRTMLGQLCAALWDSQSRLDVIQTGLEPGSVVTPLALRRSASDRCTRVSVVTPLTLRRSALDRCTRVSVVTPLALRCSASDRCTTREPMHVVPLLAVCRSIPTNNPQIKRET